MGRRILFLKWCQYFIAHCIPDIHQHVCIGEAFHCPELVSLHGVKMTIQWFTTIVLLQDFAVGDRGDAIVVKLEPSRLAVGFDECKVVAAIDVSRVHQHAV